MKKFALKIITILLIFNFLALDLQAKTNINMIGNIDDDFTLKYQDLPQEIEFKTTYAKTIPNVVSIPEGSTVKLEVINAQKELRWHKSGYILCKMISYTPDITSTPIDVTNKDIYIAVRKYEKIDKKEATIIGIELVLAQGASFFAPGVDIGYFFIKGAIQRKKHPNWFKAGVHNAYDNSICWFWLKGKDIELTSGEQVKVKDIKAKNVEKLIAKINKRSEKQYVKTVKSLAKKDKIALKKELVKEKKCVNYEIVESGLESINIDRSVIAEQ